MISLRLRLSLGLCAGLVSILGIGGVIFENSVDAEIVQRDDDELLSRAWSLANALRANDGRIDVEGLYGLTAALHDTMHPLYFEVWHRDGKLAGRSPSLGDKALPAFTMEPGPATFADVTLPNGLEGRMVGVRVAILPDGPDGEDEEPDLADLAHRPTELPAIDEVKLVMAEDLRERHATMSRLRNLSLFMGTGSLLVMLGFVLWALRRGFAPLERLAARVQTVDVHTLQLGLGDEPLPPELQSIRGRLDELLERLHAAFDREQRFTSSVAHELRTPVAEVRTLAEVALRCRDDAGSHAALAEIVVVATRMQSLVDALLLLRRFESASVPPEREDIALGVLVDDVIDDHLVRAAARDVRFEARVPDGLRLATHPSMMRSIIDNLISNAVDHAPRGSSVVIVADDSGGRLRLRVRNPAPDLSRDDIAHLFEPFWRKEAARSNPSGHFGIGLALAASLARALGHELGATLGAENELEMTLADDHGV